MRSYYREFKIIGDNGSESFDSQKRRFNILLDTISKIPQNKNVIILGDFNINIDNESETSKELHRSLQNVTHCNTSHIENTGPSGGGRWQERNRQHY